MRTVRRNSNRTRRRLRDPRVLAASLVPGALSRFHIAVAQTRTRTGVSTLRAIVERVRRATVRLPQENGGQLTAGQIGLGLLVYAAAAPDDGPDDVRYVADKVAHLRIFTDEHGKMNLDVSQAGGAVLLVSAFSVHADARHGRRPSFDSSASCPIAEPLIAQLADAIRGYGLCVETGRFAAHMLVAAINDGPICILLDSRRTV